MLAPSRIVQTNSGLLSQSASPHACMHSRVLWFGVCHAGAVPPPRPPLKRRCCAAASSQASVLALPSLRSSSAAGVEGLVSDSRGEREAEGEADAARRKKGLSSERGTQLRLVARGTLAAPAASAFPSASLSVPSFRLKRPAECRLPPTDEGVDRRGGAPPLRECHLPRNEQRPLQPPPIHAAAEASASASPTSLMVAVSLSQKERPHVCQRGAAQRRFTAALCDAVAAAPLVLLWVFFLRLRLKDEGANGSLSADLRESLDAEASELKSASAAAASPREGASPLGGRNSDLGSPWERQGPQSAGVFETASVDSRDLCEERSAKNGARESSDCSACSAAEGPSASSQERLGDELSSSVSSSLCCSSAEGSCECAAADVRPSSRRRLFETPKTPRERRLADAETNAAASTALGNENLGKYASLIAAYAAVAGDALAEDLCWLDERRSDRVYVQPEAAPLQIARKTSRRL